MSTLKSAIQKARARKNPIGSSEDVRAYMGEAAAEKAEELFDELLDELKKLGLEEIKKIASTIKKGDQGEPGKSIAGPKGDKGDAGKSIQGKPGPKGDKGDVGRGLKGDKGDAGKDGREISKKELLKKINEIENGINVTTIKGLDSLLKNLQRAIREKTTSGRNIKGGGMTIDAGSNITLVRNSNGRWTIAATASGGSNILTQQVTAVASGSDVTIDLTQLAHTASGVLIVTRNGQVLMPNGSAALPGSSWSQAGNTVTVYNADPTDICLVQYTYA